ncbi:alpha/beta hydrolase [Streptomyces olivaceiscleroticus]|uniref:alpha/beta hydrolase n=1 Tax=Streptomyces olivaceiscleroticus TaxID=68245 RepID=UPI0031F87816
MPAPLDYAHPGAATIDLAVIRHRAQGAGRALGTVFFNPGGPGGPGTQDLPAWYSLFPAGVRERFDLVSWDPRGVGESAPVRCFDDDAHGAAFFAGTPVGVPVGGREQNRWITTYEKFGALCRQRNGALLKHVSTADSARDLDRLRAAVGRARTHYWGVSYGTLLGATYRNMFPDRTGRMILDGNVSPTAWTNNGDDRARGTTTGLRIGADGAQATLRAFLDLCGTAGPAKCPFSAGNPEATRKKFTSLLTRLKKAPIPYQGTPITYGAAVSSVAGLLDVMPAQPAAGFPGWSFLAGFLQTLARGGSDGPGSPAGYDLREQGYAIECGDSPNPDDPRAFIPIGNRAQRRYGPLAPTISWADEPCAGWKATATDRYTGPWNRPTGTPALVIGNTFDPSTPHHNSVTMARLLDRARLLTVNGYGHTALLNPSTCAGRAETAYLINATLPPPGTTCTQDSKPFP